MSPATVPDVGTTYFCPICGARVTVLFAGSENLRPRCCGVAMAPVRGETLEIYFCPICGTEVAVLKDNPENLKLICCSVRMIEKRGMQQMRKGGHHA